MNIEEGKYRRTAKDFAASLSEVDAILVVCEELEYFKCSDEIRI